MTHLLPPDSIEDFHERLAELPDGLPKRLRQCADYLASHTDRIAVSTVAQVADAAGVQPSAVMRFCQLMGFSGYSEMKGLFRDSYAQVWPNYRTRLANLRETGAGSSGALLAEFVEAGETSLQNLARTVDEASLDQAVELLAGANTIHIAGLRRAFPVSSYLAYAFEKMEMAAVLHDRVAGLDLSHAIQPNDVLVAVTFSPYSPATIDLIEACQRKNVPVVAITDVVTSPLKRSDILALCVAETDFGAFRSLSATLSLATTLAVAAGAARDDQGKVD